MSFPPSFRDPWPATPDDEIDWRAFPPPVTTAVGEAVDPAYFDPFATAYIDTDTFMTAAMWSQHKPDTRVITTAPPQALAIPVTSYPESSSTRRSSSSSNTLSSFGSTFGTPQQLPVDPQPPLTAIPFTGAEFLDLSEALKFQPVTMPTRAPHPSVLLPPHVDVLPQPAPLTVTLPTADDRRRSSTSSSNTISASPSNTSSRGTVSPRMDTPSSPQAPTPTSRRRRFDPVRRRQTHETRLTGACIECWKNQKRCKRVEGPGCCRHCATMVDRLPNNPCFRSRMSSSELFRRGPTEEFCWSPRKTRWLQTAPNDAKVWLSSGCQITVSQDLGLKLSLVVKRYQPLPDDQDTYTWVNLYTGVPGRLTLPRFAVADVHAAEEAVNRYVSDNMLRHIRDKIGEAEVIPWETFQMAITMSDNGSVLLRNTLRLWTASRIIEEPWSIVGDETLGLSPTNEIGSPYHNKIPVTPVMDYQIDAITIHRVLLPLRRQILADLQKKVLENKQGSFVEIFLCIFILLHNIELTIEHDRWFAMRWNVPARFSHYELIDHVFLGANILLTHFHHVTKGWAAFNDGAAKRLAKEHREFVEAIGAAARRQKDSLEILKEKKLYEAHMFWSSQMFFEGWRPVASPCA